MEYKLKKSEFYRVAYLVSGILMFLFLFGIFNLSSYASSGTFHGWYAQENVQNESYISFLQNFDSDDFIGLYDPAFDYSWSFSITKTVLPDYTASNLTVNFLVHVVTSNGDMVVGTFLFPAGSGQSLSQSFSGSGTCFGVPTYSYLEVIASTEWARIAGNYQITSWSFNVTPRSFNPDNSYNFSDYSSYSPVSIISSFSSTSAYGDKVFNVGNIYNFSFPDYSGTDSAFQNAWIFINNTESTKYTYSFYFSTSVQISSVPNITLYVRDPNNTPVHTLNFNLTPVGGTVIGDYHYYCSVDFILEDAGIYQLLLQGSYPTTISSPSYSLSVFKGTISDYMDYVQNQWANISPNVTQTNNNIADSVSTVGAASTYETAQFTSFDNLVTQTGVDSFSLSTVSTPLLWVGGLITTCYNNLPSAIQYLLMFVGVFGLIVIILNSGSRVIRRFGGDS